MPGRLPKLQARQGRGGWRFHASAGGRCGSSCTCRHIILHNWLSHCLLLNQLGGFVVAVAAMYLQAQSRAQAAKHLHVPSRKYSHPAESTAFITACEALEKSRSCLDSLAALQAGQREEQGST